MLLLSHNGSKSMALIVVLQPHNYYHAFTQCKSHCKKISFPTKKAYKLKACYTDTPQKTRYKLLHHNRLPKPTTPLTSALITKHHPDPEHPPQQNLPKASLSYTQLKCLTPSSTNSLNLPNALKSISHLASISATRVTLTKSLDATSNSVLIIVRHRSSTWLAISCARRRGGLPRGSPSDERGATPAIFR